MTLWMLARNWPGPAGKNRTESAIFHSVMVGRFQPDRDPVSPMSGGRISNQIVGASRVWEHHHRKLICNTVKFYANYTGSREKTRSNSTQ
ncbi:MAG: hypothetical protein ABJD13_09355 [Paracoccaceae bacterium]